SSWDGVISLRDSIAARRARSATLSAERLLRRRGSILPEGSTTAMRVGSPFIENIRAGTTADPAASSGNNRVPMSNDHFSTTFRYSCRTMAKNLYIFGPDHSFNFFDKDIVQAGLDLLELRNGCTGPDETPQQVVGSNALREM